MTEQQWQIILWVLEWGGLLLLAIYLVYTLLMFLSDRWTTKWLKKSPIHQSLISDEVLPSITLIIPACNEESVIEKCVESAIHLSYDNYKVLIVNDGSIDSTLQKLLVRYRMKEMSLRTRTRVSPTQALGMYHSELHSNLFVLDKSNTGKADSLNCALQYVDTRLFALCDADSVLDPGALKILVRPFLEKSEKPTIAVGAAIRVQNTDEQLKTKTARLLYQFQRLEYLRAFFCGRICWNYWGDIYIISGAIGLYDTETALLTAGIPVASQTEDLDFTFRLHVYHRAHQKPYRMIFLPNAVCSTSVPTTVRSLVRQRYRWHRGLLEILMSYRGIFLNPIYGRFGSIIFLYLLWVELLSSGLEWLLLILTVVALGSKILTWNWIVVWAGVGMLWSLLVNLYLISMVRRHFPDEMNRKMSIHFLWIGFFECLGYHQFVSLIRVFALNPFKKKEDLSWRIASHQSRMTEHQ
jgi:cellulose synthase/poly-beta-1,6-N-acetylglucosamine synthase-like glycosyltransferase